MCVCAGDFKQIYIHVNINLFINTYTYIYTCMYIYTYTYTYVHVCMIENIYAQTCTNALEYINLNLWDFKCMKVHVCLW